MKTFIAFILIALSGVYSQPSKIAVIVNPQLGFENNSILFDSLIQQIDSSPEISALVISGNLTLSAKDDQFQMLKSSLEKISKPYFLIPGRSDAGADANTWINFINNFGSDNFFFELNGIILTSLNPNIPLTTFRHYTVEDIDWLDSELSKISPRKELYFFCSDIFDQQSDNWKEVFNHLLVKNFKMLINGRAEKESFRNINGIYTADFQSTFNQKKRDTFYYTIEIRPDSIIIGQKTIKGESGILNIIDKSVDTRKSEIIPVEPEFSGVDIKMKAELNTSLYCSPLYWNGRFYTAERGGLISCIDTTGEILWDYDTYSEIYRKPVIADRILAAATVSGDVITISAVTGEQIQSIGFDEIITTDLSVFDFEGTPELMMPKLTTSKSALLFGTASGLLYSYDFETLQKLWVNNSSKGMITGSPVCVSNKILFTSRDGYLYCIDARNGLLIWKWRSAPNSDIYNSQILCDGKKVFVVSLGGLFSIDLLLGKTLWSNTKNMFCGSISLSTDRSVIQAYSDKDKFILISADRGTEKKTVPFECRSISNFPPNNAGERYLLNTGGSVFLLNGKGIPSEILSLGKSPLLEMRGIGENKFLVSNLDGQIIVFGLK